MVNQSKVCQGERNLDQRSEKVVTHKFDYQRRGDEDYEQGVSVELSPLFDFSIEPWTLLPHLMRQLIIADRVIKLTGVDKEAKTVKVLDVGCNYGELWTLLARRMKAGGAKIQYIGVDIDKDKKIIAEQLRYSIDYRIMDVLEIENLPENPFDVIVAAEMLEHLEEEKAIDLLQTMYYCLVPGGHLILSVPTPESETHRDNPFHIKLWNAGELVDACDNMGYLILDYFQLGIGKIDWSEITVSMENRIPRDFARLFESTLYGGSKSGADTILIARSKMHDE